MDVLIVTNLGILAQYHSINALSYKEVWNFQTILHNAIKQQKKSASYRDTTNISESKILNHIIFCEHNPVFTLGKSAKADNLLHSESQLREAATELFKINRGGDITYHGPGQLTGYLILDLELLYRDVHRYVLNVEECIIRLLKSYDLKGERMDDFTGVWIKDERGSRKICAIGVHLSRWVSMHGFGFNISTDLHNFQKIIPCGIDDKDKTVTSLSKELNRHITIEEVTPKLKSIISEVFELSYLDI